MNTPKPRPYWHVDLKWMFGIMAFLTLWGALLMNAFATLSERQNATDITSSIITSVLKDNGIDSASTFDQLRAEAAALPDDATISIPNLPAVSITKTELVTKSNEELQKLAIAKLTGPIYDQGIEEAAKNFSTDTTKQQEFKQQAGILGVISKQTHDALKAAAVTALITSLVWFAGLIYFSAGWGRLVSPGVILLLVSPLGATLGSLLEFLSKKTDTNSLFSFMPPSVMANIATALNSTYRTAFFIGVGLLVAAGIGKLVTKNMPKKPSQTV